MSAYGSMTKLNKPSNFTSRRSGGHDWKRSRDMARRGTSVGMAERFRDDRSASEGLRGLITQEAQT